MEGHRRRKTLVDTSDGYDVEWDAKLLEQFPSSGRLACEIYLIFGEIVKHLWISVCD